MKQTELATHLNTVKFLTTFPIELVEFWVPGTHGVRQAGGVVCLMDRIHYHHCLHSSHWLPSQQQFLGSAGSIVNPGGIVTAWKPGWFINYILQS